MKRVRETETHAGKGGWHAVSAAIAAATLLRWNKDLAASVAITMSGETPLQSALL